MVRSTSTNDERVQYVQAMYFGGPNDSEVWWTTLPVRLDNYPLALLGEPGGQMWSPRYVRRSGELGTILSFVLSELHEGGWYESHRRLTRAFEGKRSLMYDCVEHAPSGFTHS